MKAKTIRIINKSGASINNVLALEKAMLTLKNAYNFRKKNAINYQKKRFILLIFQYYFFYALFFTFSLRINYNRFNLNNYLIASIAHIKKITLYKRNNFYN